MKKIFKYYFLISFIFLIFIQIIASAETGSIPISDDQVLNYGIGTTGTLGSSVNFSKIVVDNADYNYLASFHATLSDATFVNEFESTSFTFASGATGGTGNVWYDKNYSSVYYSFPSNMIITGSTIVIIPQKNIFVNVTGGTKWINTALTTSAPVAIFTSSGSNNLAPGTYVSVTISAKATDTYSVSYSNNLFMVSVVKNPSLSSKYIIHGASSVYSTETTYNKVNINNATFVYNDGLYLNATLASGVFSNVLINSTGISGFVLPTVPPSINPITHGGLAWNKNNYTNGEIGILAYQFDAGLFESWFAHWIEISNDAIPFVQKFDNLGISGSVSYQFTTTGSVTGKYYKCLFLTCAFPTLIDSKTVQISSGKPTQLFPKQKYDVGVQDNISYYLNPFYTNDFSFYYWSESSQKYILSYQSWGTPTGNGNKSFTCGLATKYKIILDTATVYTTCVVNHSISQYNITSSYLNVSSLTPTLIDYLDTEYAVDGTNWTNNITYIKVYDNHNIEIFSYPLTTQRATIPFFLVSSPHEWNDMVVTSGVNTIKLISQTGLVLDSKIINVSEVSSTGYGLIMDKDKYCVSEKITFKYYSPDIVNITLWDSTGTLVSKGLLNASISGKKTFFIYSIPGKYDVRLTWSGIQYANDMITIDSCIPTTTTTVVNPGNQIDNMTKNPWMWAFIIIIVCFALGLSYGLPGGIIGSAIGVLGSYGLTWIPNWAVFIYVLALIIVIALFGGQVTTTSKRD